MDSGSKRINEDLVEGVKGLIKKVKRIANGKDKLYPIGSKDHVAKLPYFSEELFLKWVENIDNLRTPDNYYWFVYPVTPGFDFTYTGQINQFPKLYCTGARSNNGYVNTFLSFYKKFGFKIKPESKIIDLINLDK